MSTPNPSFPKGRIQQCALCRYNLSDQPVEYIPDYHLMALQCPECGQRQPAGLIAQPWKYRRIKATFMNSMWVFLLTMTMIATIASLVGLSQSTAYASLEPFSDEIGEMYRQWYQNKLNSNQSSLSESGHVGLGNTVTYNSTTPQRIPVDWWYNEGGKEQATQAFTFSKHVNRVIATDWLWFILIGPIIGFWFRLLLDRTHKFTQLSWVGIPIIGSGLIIFYYFSSPFDYHTVSTTDCALDAIGHIIAWPTYILGTISILISYFAMIPLNKLIHRKISKSPYEVMPQNQSCTYS